MSGKIKSCVLAVMLAAIPVAVQAQVVISQVYGGGGNSGAVYTNDFIEIFNAGAAPQDLTGWSVQYTSAAGTNWGVTPLTGVSLQPGQYYLIQQAAGTGGTTPLPTPDATGSLMMSGTNGKALLARVLTAQSVACPTGADIADQVGFGSANCPTPTAALSNTTAAIRKTLGCTNTGNNSNDFDVAAPTPRNTTSTLNACGGPGVPAISSANVSVMEGDSGLTPMLFEIELSAPAGAGGVTFNFATVDGSAAAPGDYESVSGTRTILEGASSAMIMVNAVGNTIAQADRSFTLNLTAINGALPATLSITGTIEDDDIATLAIHAIQGSGLASPVVGQRVLTQNNIVTAVGPAGYFIQTPDAAIDADPLTSEGIYVFTGSPPATIAVGDSVTLTGNVVEFSGLTELTTISNLVINSGNNPLPAPIAFDESRPSPDPDNLSCGTLSNLECYEGMRVGVADGIVARANQYFGATDSYAQVFVSASATRSLRAPGTLYPLVPGVGNPAAGTFTGNPHIFELDADALGAVPANTEITGGTRFSAVGVMTFNFGDYDLLPTEFTVIEAAPIPRAVSAGQLGAELRIGAFNMLRLCDTIANNTTVTCGNGGEPDVAALALKISRLSDYVGNVLEIPDVLGVVEVENLAVLQQLADRIALDHSITYTAYLEEGNDIGGIDVGYLVRADRISGVVVTQLDKQETWIDPRDGQLRVLHDRPTLLLEGTFAGDSFATLVIHPKSRSCVDRPTGGDCNQAEVDRNRAKRFTQARSIALRVQEQQTANPSRPLLVIGDFNDYQFSDGFVNITGLIEGTYDNDANVIDLSEGNIVTPRLWNAVTSLPANEQYSFLFTEQFGAILGYTTRDVPIMQALDQALLNTVARSWFAGFEFGRANLDAADQTERLSTTAVGVSDHDGFVVRLATDRLFADSFGGE